MPLIPLDVISDVALAHGFASAGVSAGIRVLVGDKFVVELAVGFDMATLERLWQSWGRP